MSSDESDFIPKWYLSGLPSAQKRLAFITMSIGILDPLLWIFPGVDESKFGDPKKIRMWPISYSFHLSHLYLNELHQYFNYVYIMFSLEKALWNFNRWIQYHGVFGAQQRKKNKERAMNWAD